MKTTLNKREFECARLAHQKTEMSKAGETTAGHTAGFTPGSGCGGVAVPPKVNKKEVKDGWRVKSSLAVLLFIPPTVGGS